MRARASLPQTRRHSLICSLLGIRHVVLAVNKLDLVDFDRDCFDAIADDYRALCRRSRLRLAAGDPALGALLATMSPASPRMPWYDGPSLLDYLETVDVDRAAATRPFRFPVQWVNRPNVDFRGFAGTVAAGSVAPGDPVVVAGSGRPSRIKEIVTFDGPLDRAAAGDAVTLTLDRRDRRRPRRPPGRPARRAPNSPTSSPRM